MSEHANQCALVTWWSWAHAQYGLPEFALFAIPNGGARSKATGGKLKAEGVRSGVLDLCLAVRAKNYTCLWIEMKYGNNTLSDNQDKFAEFVQGQGAKVAVCWNWEDARREVMQYLSLAR